MKCAACGYDDDNNGKTSIACTDFIEIEIDDRLFVYTKRKEHYIETRYAKLFACPICGTVKMEV